VRNALTLLHGAAQSSDGKAKQHIEYRLQGIRIKLLLSMPLPDSDQTAWCNKHGDLLSILEEYNNETYWREKTIQQQQQQEKKREEEHTENGTAEMELSKKMPMSAEAHLSTAIPLAPVAPVAPTPTITSVDQKHGEIPWCPVENNTLPIEDRMFRVACDVIHELHAILEDDMYFHRARFLLASIYCNLSKANQTSLATLASRATNGNTPDIRAMVSVEHGRDLVEFVYNKLSSKPKRSNPIRVWKDDGRDRECALLLNALDRHCQRKYDRVRAKSVRVTVHILQQQNDYRGMTQLLKKLRMAPESKSTLFQELIRMVIRAIGRVSLKEVKAVVGGGGSNTSGSGQVEGAADVGVASSTVWLKRMYMLFVVTCKKDEYYSQPDVEHYLCEMFRLVKNGTSSTKMSLQNVVTKLNRIYPELQGVAIVKRSRHRLRRSFPRKQKSQ